MEPTAYKILILTDFTLVYVIIETESIENLSVIVLGLQLFVCFRSPVCFQLFKKNPVVSFVIIIRIAVEDGFVLVRRIINNKSASCNWDFYCGFMSCFY